MSGYFREKICSIIFLIILLSALNVSAADYPEFVGYVNDYAKILSAPQASSLNQELRDFDNRTTIELAVVTVDSIGRESPQDYAVNIANYWGVGKRGKDNGIIFLVAMESHDIWIESGSGLSEQISDSQIQEIVDDVIIPQFRASRPDAGVIDGARSIISHFDDYSQAGLDTAEGISSQPAPQPLPQNSGTGNSDFFGLAKYALLIVLLGFFIVLGIQRQSLTRKNNAKIDDLKKMLDELVDREAASLEALKELKANYVPSVWKSAEEAFNLVDHSHIELELSKARKTAKRGLIYAESAESQISDLDETLKRALANADEPYRRLDYARNARQKCPAILAGLEAAFPAAEREIAGGMISMATRMNLEAARHNYQEALALMGQPEKTVDWIALYETLGKVQGAVAQASQDAVRDRAIAEKIRGQDPDEMLAKMKRTLDEAERTMKPLGAANGELNVARRNMTRLQYHSVKDNAIDYYLIMDRMNTKIVQGRAGS